MSPSIRTSFSWLSWKAASGAPNCFLSFKYLVTDRLWDSGSLTRIWSNKLETDVVMWYTPMAHVKNSHWYAYWLPCHHNARHGKHLLQKLKVQPNKNLHPTKHGAEVVVKDVSSTLFISRNELMPGNLSSSGTNTLFKTMSPFCTILSPILFSIFVAFRPGAPFFTINLDQMYQIQYQLAG